MAGYIDIVCNLFDPASVRLKQNGLDDEFKKQVRMDPAIRERRHDAAVPQADGPRRDRTFATDRGSGG
jgi:hypothetical protein